ncbi:MAG: hypothetical protein U0166_08070 [Acidobacteriota bacterium]
MRRTLSMTLLGLVLVAIAACGPKPAPKPAPSFRSISRSEAAPTVADAPAREAGEAR